MTQALRLMGSFEKLLELDPSSVLNDGYTGFGCLRGTP